MREPRPDVVVVGGGTAGCVLAARLAVAGRRVLLLEAGGRYRPALLGPPLPSQRARRFFSWNYHSVEQRGLERRRIRFPLGRVLGGSSSVNAMMFCPGLPDDYDGWARSGNVGWSWEHVSACLDRATRGGGPVRVSRPGFRSAFSRAVVSAGAELGLDLGFYDVSQHGGRRTSAAAYLPMGVATGRLRVRTGVTVTRVLFRGTRAMGVEFVRRGRTHRVLAGDVVLSAGAVNSPQLLMLSGIGEADHLRSLGIPVVVDLPGVGADLRDHIRVPVLFRTDRPGPGDVRYWAPAALEYLIRRTGVMTSNCCEAGGFLRSDPGLEAPDLQLVTHFKTPHGPRLVDLELCLLRPRSRGRVRLRSASPRHAPHIDPGYLTDPADLPPLLRGVEIVRRLAATHPLRGLPLGPEVGPGAAVTRDADLVRYFRRTVETCYHLAGTCRMGVDDRAVVDPALRVRGVEGLRVADTSVMPTLIHGNTQAPALAIGERAAELIEGPAAAGSSAPDLDRDPGVRLERAVRTPFLL